MSNCDNNGTLVPGIGPWPFLGNDQTTTDNEAIVPLCKDKNNDIGGGSAGSVGWLDLSTALGATTTGSCANQLQERDPESVHRHRCRSRPGSRRSRVASARAAAAIQDDLNAFHNDVVQIPLFDGTCKQQPPGPTLADCAPGEIGVGRQHLVPHPELRSFKLDYFYIDGNDRKECDKLPGQPFVSGNGANGCFKGWWVIALPGPGAVGLGTVTPSTTNQLGVQLIK